MEPGVAQFGQNEDAIPLFPPILPAEACSYLVSLGTTKGSAGTPEDWQGPSDPPSSRVANAAGVT